MSNDEQGEIITPGKAKIVPWVEFEREVAEFIEKTIPQGKWGVCPILASVHRKPKYYSKDREKDLIFDVSIEVRPAERPDQMQLLWLIECKNYPDRSVTVDEIEEFHDKMDQVEAHKGTVVTRVGFDSGALTYAKNKRIELATLQKEEWWTLQFSADGGAFAETIIGTPFFLDGTVESCRSLTEALGKTMCQFGVPMLPANLGQRSISFEGEQLTWTPLDTRTKGTDEETN